MLSNKHKMKIEKIDNLDHKDLIYIAQLYIDTYSREPWEDQLDLEGVIDYFTRSILNKASFYVGYLGTKPVAMAIVLDVVSYKTNYSRIEDICVDWNLQERGLGSEFLKLLEDSHINENIDVMILNTIRRFPARKFYEKNGYTIIEDSVTMFKQFN